MALDPGLQIMLDQLAAAGGPAMQDLPVADARVQYRMLALLDGEPEAVDAVTDTTVAGAAGDLPARAYRPAGAGAEPLPVLAWFHGGGFVIGDLDTADPTARKLANRSGALVVSVDYRLAPEARFPAAADDAVAATQWLAKEAGALGGDGSRLAVGGDSAGGNLAAVAAQRAGVELRAQALVYPVTDLRRQTVSYQENGEGYLLTAEGMRWFIEHYLGPGGEPTDPVGSPVLADDVRGVAPAIVVTAGFDPLRDEGLAYADRLEAAGVPVERLAYDDMVHGFAVLGSLTARADEMLTAVGERLRARLAP